MAACPNVTCKLEGMGIPRWGFGWHITAVPIGSEELADTKNPEFEHRAHKPNSGAVLTSLLPYHVYAHLRERNAHAIREHRWRQQMEEERILSLKYPWECRQLAWTIIPGLRRQRDGSVGRSHLINRWRPPPNGAAASSGLAQRYRSIEQTGGPGRLGRAFEQMELYELLQGHDPDADVPVFPTFGRSAGRLDDQSGECGSHLAAGTSRGVAHDHAGQRWRIRGCCFGRHGDWHRFPACAVQNRRWP